jgi:hypothetical protein
MFTQNHKTEIKNFLKEHWALSSVLLWSWFICILSLTYISVGIFWWTIAPTVVLLFCALFYIVSLHKNISINENHFLPVSIIVIDILLGYSMWHGRIDGAMQSPWLQIQPWFFPVFFLTTALLLYVLWDKKPTPLLFVGATTHFLLFFCIALLAFRFGYAYDPLIHQAAEKYVALHGKITPLQPFYIGQYALVATLHIISRIPVELIDRLLLPILSGISLPIIGFIGLSKGWNVSRNKALLASSGLLLISLAELTFTVPYNMSVLMLLWWIILLPYALETRGGKITLIALSLAATMFHPLIGIPLCLGTIISIVLKKFPHKYIAIIGSSLIGIALASMLGIYRMTHGETFITSTFDLQNFIRIFSFTNDMSHVRPRTQLLYGLHFLIPYIIIAAGISLRKKTQPIIRWTLFSISGGILFGIFLISTLISIPGIVNYEQNEFVLRLKNALPLFFIPLIISHIDNLRYKKIAIILCAILISFSLYFSYPRIDGVTKPGWNVSHSDIEVTKSIPQLANNKPYIVISNQILAATGLRELGFDHRLIVADTIDTYPYTIGMSEPIYPLTQKILYEELNGVDVRTLAHLISGPVFVAVHNYWYRFDEIANEAHIAGADKTYQFDGITVYEFN